MKTIYLTVILTLSFSCQKEDMASTSEKLNDKTAIQVISELPAEIIEALNRQGSTEGALSRNNPDYFHVRFQIDIGFIAAHATYFKSESSLLNGSRCIAYSFEHQKTAGDFEVMVPANLQHLGEPVPSDLASGVAFFGSAMGMGLSVLNQSSWYESLPAEQSGKKIIEEQRPKMLLMMNWLKQQEQTLIEIDERAANRLFWNARCFYAMGLFLSDAESIAVGERFIELALTKQDAAGFFIENGGFDSSYNSVSLLVGIQVYTILPAGKLKDDLGAALVRSVQWQISRINSNGEISLEGNTRVYPGGETFLGEAKTVAWTDCALAMYWLQSLTENDAYFNVVSKLRGYYE